MLQERVSGVLLHPTSLPGPHGVGDLGVDAYRFVDFLSRTRQRLWQVLPLGPTGRGHSPYSCQSAFAGNPLMISLERLREDGLLTGTEVEEVDRSNPFRANFSWAYWYKGSRLRLAYERFRALPDRSPLKMEHERFCYQHNRWLDPFAQFMALKNRFGDTSWLDWDPEFACPDELGWANTMHAFFDEANYQKFVQFIFFRQWYALKAYANERGIRIVGDIPIYVSLDSADVWGERAIFALNEKGFPKEVGGVPPDYFSQTGQLWGNPVYNWEYLKSTGYHWWIERFRHNLSLADIIRVDHFRGFEAYWSVPYGETTAVNGQWRKGPAEALFFAVEKALGPIPIIAEDLGMITPEVIALRERFAFPGMKIMHFSFEGQNGFNHLFYDHDKNYVIYPGNHDNDTTLSWFLTLPSSDREKLLAYFRCDGRDVVWEMIRFAMASNYNTALFAMQDLLDLGVEARMNLPGTINDKNWMWRFAWSQIDETLMEKLSCMTVLYRRWSAKDGAKSAM
ncbi:4-alpha-glucanotransferase [Heliobacterium gestii]|uniref:4-alpha-glucanotransferase n=1 Tax=Heliomicrobium gestii TaxID=2699 RepID=A0A845L7H5_HELGE|nr:4-alpha-glucanotransferase [Heliomicrobium gestii]